MGTQFLIEKIQEGLGEMVRVFHWEESRHLSSYVIFLATRESKY